MDFTLTEEQQRVADSCKVFAQSVIFPQVRQLEEELDVRRNLFQKMALEGMFTLVLSQSTGCIGYIVGLKEIAKVDAGIGVAMAVTNMVAEAIDRFGTHQQKDVYLPRIVSGQCVPLSFAITEKQAGSDVKAITTTYHIDPQDAEYVIVNGEKQFITNGDIAGALVVLAKDKNQEGMSAFLIDGKTPGVSVISKEEKLGLLTANLVSLQFDNCRIPKTSFLGEPGNGLKVMLSSLDSGRLGIAAQALGIAEAAFEAALHFSKERLQFGHPIGENQSIAFKLADMRVKIDAARWMLFYTAWLKDQVLPFSMEAAEAKLYCSEVCNEIANEGLQIHGGYGYVKRYPAEKYFRDARVTTLYEGTSEIQRIIIARHL